MLKEISVLQRTLVRVALTALQAIHVLTIRSVILVPLDAEGFRLTSAAPQLLQLLGLVSLLTQLLKIQVTGRNKGRVLYVYMFRLILPILIDNDKRGMLQRRSVRMKSKVMDGD